MDEIIEKQGLRQVTDKGEIEKLVDRVIAENAAQPQQFRDGITFLDHVSEHRKSSEYAAILKQAGAKTGVAD